MDNQHRQIKGYRDLSQAEIDLMNKIKVKGEELNELLKEVRTHYMIQDQNTWSVDGTGMTAEQAAEHDRLSASEPGRWHAIAKTHFQEGLMALTRTVAQPTFF